MNFFQLECFVMAVEKKSFAEVAAAMHVTQPTITYQMNNLEEELEEKLFSRTKRGVEATRAGQVFYDDARGILAEYHHALEHFRHALSLTDAVIRVGFTRPPDNYDIFSAINRYRTDHPDTVIDVEQGLIASDSSSAQVDHYDIILHYVYNDQDFMKLPGFSYTPLGSCPYYVLVSEASPLAKRASLTLSDLQGLKLLTLEEYKLSRFQVPSLEELKKAGIEVGLLNDMNQLIYAIADRAGFGVYPAKYREVKAGFVRIPLVSQPPLPYGLLYHDTRSAAVDDFLQYLIRELTP